MLRQNDSPHRGKTMFGSSGTAPTTNNGSVSTLRSVFGSITKAIASEDLSSEAFSVDSYDRYSSSSSSLRYEESSSSVSDPKLFRLLQQRLKQQGCVTHMTVGTTYRMLLQEQAAERAAQIRKGQTPPKQAAERKVTGSPTSSMDFVTMDDNQVADILEKTATSQLPVPMMEVRQ